MSDADTEYCSIREASERTGVHPDTIRRRIADGTIEAVRFGPRLIRVRTASLARAARPLQYVDGAA